jgi:hypothetical protein
MRLNSFAVPIFALSLIALTSPSIVRAAPQQGPPPPGMPGPQGGWDAPPSEFRDVQRQGFHDGIEGARRDFDNHRPPNPNNRDEFRHPRVPRGLRNDYREGFRQGYDRAMRHLMGDRDQHRDHDRGPY